MSTDSRRPIHFNPAARSWKSPGTPLAELETILKFHRQLSNYEPSRLVSLDSVAQDLGVQSVYLKDESTRLGLPSFKILGASWAVARSVAQKLGLDPDNTDLASIRQRLVAISAPIVLFAATEGNHGRAVARMGAMLSIPVEIHVPAGTDPVVIDLIQDEGAKVVISGGDYDVAMRKARDNAGLQDGGILIQDCAFDTYNEIPQWIVEGYKTMMAEIDEQLGGVSPNLVVTPVGVGSLAQAVTTHFKSGKHDTSILTVEPDTAACLWQSLERGQPVSVNTTDTIMAGLNCGTLSTAAWPLLRAGVDASMSISDYESHVAALELHGHRVSAGPCGAASLAALRALTTEDKTKLGLNQSSVIVILCTEGSRDHAVPHSVSTEDAALLTQILVKINSANPLLGSIPGPGERAIASYIRSWLEYRNIETHWIEPTPGRPSILGVVRGSGGGKSLMFNGHIDTVTNLGYEGDALSGELKDGKIYGRGSLDMKGGVAAALVALARAKRLGLRGDVIFAGVADEEAESLGTEQLLEAGWRADGAIISEPTNLDVVYTHKGFVWLEVDVHGLAAHGSRPELGVDAITKAGYLLVELDRYAQQLRQIPTDSPVGPPSVHASIIKGGEEASSYPARCTITIERRSVAGETAETIRLEIQTILDKLSRDVPDFRADLRVKFHRSAFSIPLDHPFTSLVADVVEEHLNHTPRFRGEAAWTDCALLADKGIPVLMWGPRGAGLHAKEEYVEAESVQVVADALTGIAARFCQ